MGWRELVHALVPAWGCWSPALSPDSRRLAYVSDRSGSPELWVQGVDDPASAVAIPLSPDPVLTVRWSADGDWLACDVATGGGVRGEVWLVRPSGADARCVAGGGGRHAETGPWSRSGARLAVRFAPEVEGEDGKCVILDAGTGARDLLVTGALVTVLDVSADGEIALLRDGTRGARFCSLLDRRTGRCEPALPERRTGATEAGMLRPAPGATNVAAYLVSDTGHPLRELVGVAVHGDGSRGPAGSLESRPDGDLELVHGDDGGERLVLSWNVAGRSEVEVWDCRTRAGRAVEALAGGVVSDVEVARDGRTAVLTLESAASPRRLWLLDLATLETRPVTPASVPSEVQLVDPELLSFSAQDGLPLSGWLYRSAPAPGAVMVYLHGGPEAQERPGWHPLYQVLATAGISVFAPNVRGSSGFGRAFEHADVRHGRYDAIADVRRCVDVLLAKGVAEWGRVAVSGWSYGGYLAMAAMASYPYVFAAGVTICGMSDLLTFYRDTEPWIAAAAVSKYGHPVRDRLLLQDLSPLRHIERVEAPVMVIHGELDTNVPAGESRRLVAALRRRDHPVDYLPIEGEGHVFRRVETRVRVTLAQVEFLTARL